MNTLEKVKHYFELSNNADLEAIFALLDDNATYSSDNVGVHYGKNDISKMKKKFFSTLKEQNWNVSKYDLVADNIVKCTFTFKGKSLDGQDLSKEGVETVVINDSGMIQHVEVRNI